jgi:hypothetical protein
MAAIGLKILGLDGWRLAPRAIASGAVRALGFSLLGAALPAWSGPAMDPPAASGVGWAQVPAPQGTAVRPAASAIKTPPTRPAWAPLPPSGESAPAWVRLPTGAGSAPGWSPPSPPVINLPPSWQMP